ncbi:hypothetical protein, conserved [Eimeria tenella]|uniref:Uncharacterized protein n=1 Tax=Eimeria tenella TaxID=5802 RepID=U6L076_EIMTE|nr:hypothetical protein, conserved [Eimeria tenella]CDJ41969.1 hypothetical protein, conserved [Eimeria tenella]|eukprot:XP_013232719.1 hypothetical protein, conserved [Eimeria tenella]
MAFLSTFGSERPRTVFFRGSRWDSTRGEVPSSSDSSSSRSRVRFSRVSQPAYDAWDVGGGTTAAAAAGPQQQQQQQHGEFLVGGGPSGSSAGSHSAVVGAHIELPAAASPSSAGSVSGAAAAATGAGAATAATAAAAAAAADAAPGESFLQVLSSADACALSSGSTGLRVRKLLSWGALGLLAAKLLLRPDRSLRPRKVLLLDFVSTLAAGQLLELLPPFELRVPPEQQQQQQQGAFADTCDQYAAALLIEELLWLFTLKFLLRQAESLFGYRQGEYLAEEAGFWEDSEACQLQVVGPSSSPPDSLQVAGPRRRAAALWGVHWGKYLQQLLVLLACVAAAQLVTLLLLTLLAAPLAPLVALPLWLLHRDNAALRRFMVAFAWPMCTDLVQFCSIDALIRRRPPPTPPKTTHD